MARSGSSGRHATPGESGRAPLPPRPASPPADDADDDLEGDDLDEDESDLEDEDDARDSDDRSEVGPPGGLVDQGPPRGATREPERRPRGRQPGSWPDGLDPGVFEAYRAKFGLSEQRLADYLGVSLQTLRNWTKGGKAPTVERHAQLRALLAQDYVWTAPADRRPRPGVGPAPAPGADLAPGPSGPPPVTLRPVSTAQAIVELALAYVRSPGGQNLTPAQLIDLLERIKRTID